MTRPEDMHPTTDTEVYEMLHAMFGIGDWEEGDVKPWHKVRMVEVAKIKAIRGKRHWTFGDFGMVARYCHVRGVRITKAWDLLAYHGPARLEEINNARLRREEGAQAAAAMELAAALPDSQDWAGRLTRASGKARDDLLHEWETTRRVLMERGRE